MSEPTPPVGPVRAAGACVWRPGTDGEVEVLLVHRPKYDDWSLPKGKVDPGEHPLVTAVREVREETGHAVALGRPLAVQRYPADGRPKVVDYWAARADDAAPDWTATSEIDRQQWVATWQAASVLTHSRDADVVRALAAGPPATVPVVVLRHAEAVPRKSWEGRESRRPLSATGTEVAEQLVALLSTYGPTRLVSSDTERCEQTIGPLAAATGITVETDGRLSEAGYEGTPPATVEALRALLADGRPTVLCTHRPVLPALRLALECLAADGVGVPASPLRTGDFLVAHCSRGQVVGAEQHSPTAV